MILIFKIASASYGVGWPVPQIIELTRGESGRLYFSIDAHAHGNDLLCVYPLDKKSPLIIEFDNNETTVEAGKIVRVHGTITVPSNLVDGLYEETFCLDCNDVSLSGGTAVKSVHCGVPIRASVVSARTKVNEYVPAKPTPLKKPFPIFLVAISSAVIILLIVYLIYRQRKKKTSTSKVAKKRAIKPKNKSKKM